MSREVELLGQVIADLQGRLVSALELNESLKDSAETNRLAQERANETVRKEIEKINAENAQLRSALDRAIAELRLRIKDRSEFDGVFNSLNRIHR